MRAGHRRCQPGLLRLLPVLQREARRRAETGPARPAHRGGWSRSAGMMSHSHGTLWKAMQRREAYPLGD
eukprot:s539_g20.t1